LEIVKKTYSYISILLPVFLVLLLLLSFFRNIKYPLLWNDEATTAVFARSVLRNGYPKAHDEKNNLNPTIPDDKSLCIKEEIDAYLCIGWGHYYLAAPFVYLADKTNDLYTKTALVRFPFSLLAFMAILMFPLIALKEIKSFSGKILFYSGFLVFELLSVFLALHASQVRYYSLLLFLSALLILIYSRYRIFGGNKHLYIVLVPILLVLVFISYYPAYAVFIITFILQEFLFFMTKKNKLKTGLAHVGLTLSSLIITLPLMIFFETFKISKEYSNYLTTNLYGGKYTLTMYIKNLLSVYEFFFKQEFLFVLFILKMLLLWILYKKGKDKIIKLLRENKSLQISNLLTLFFINYIFIVSRIPYLFTRYFYIEQPILSLIILIDTVLIINLTKPKKDALKAYAIYFASILILSGAYKIQTLRLYFYELTHTYKGPLDYAIGYIHKNYENPEKLVIATNYEELAFIFYLNSRVIIGAVGNELEKDMKIEPDIIIPRKDWKNIEYLEDLLAKGTYEKVSFPIYDYKFNNISELQWHLFKTKYATSDDEKLTIYLKK